MKADRAGLPSTSLRKGFGLEMDMLSAYLLVVLVVIILFVSIVIIHVVLPGRWASLVLLSDEVFECL